MAAAMAGREHDVETVEHAEQELVRGLAIRGFYPLPMRVLDACNVINAAAAQNAKNSHLLLLGGGGVSSPWVKWETGNG